MRNRRTNRIGIALCSLLLTAALVRAAEPEPTALATDSRLFDMSYLPAETRLAISLRPMTLGRLSLAPAITKFPAAISVQFNELSTRDSASLEVDEHVIISFAEPLVTPAGRPPRSEYVHLLRTHIPLSFEVLYAKVFREMSPTRKSAQGYEYLAASTMTGLVMACVLVDEYTLAILPEKHLDLLTTAHAQTKPAWSDKWEAARQNPIAVAMSSPLPANMPATPTNPADRFLRTASVELKLVMLQAKARDGGFDISMTGSCTSPTGAEACAFVTHALLGLAAESVKPFVDNVFSGKLETTHIVELLRRSMVTVKTDIEECECLASGRIEAEVGDTVAVEMKTAKNHLAAAKRQESEAKEAETLKR